MSSTVAQSTLPTLSTVTSSMDPESNIPLHHMIVLGIYTVVLLCGTVSLSLMIHVLKSSATSTTSIAVLNLIFTHFIFLLTLPFRLYYYATNKWTLGHGWCKMVSAMIHIHMYMSFIFYVIILIMRLLAFYKKDERVPTFRRMHALLFSVVVWVIVLVSYPCITHFTYGYKKNPSNRSHNHNHTECFQFGEKVKEFKGINYVISVLIIVVAVVLTALQANVLRVLYRQHKQIWSSQQDFGAQLKSLCFALIMVACFIPYHIFRLYYIGNFSGELEIANEVFLSLTTFNCLDMLTFLGRRTFRVCLPGRAA
ncbi:probable G-protein coupled receptor 141 [Mugil cephalus]|uniref:probable G-protein coupled receptor 141 n=1 Tax=Mugil cephalus TaxID=48193 RepID=UPI001FB77859|nr:probable G-protein coupled receptor 141 [Mugil cephalus]XP_047424640.1 probable G-protein coupled receptor 141 [Mugil cephalus]